MVSIAIDLPDPFVSLDREWRAICRRSRRSGLPQEWASEPAVAGLVRLAELIPSPGVDRDALSAAMVRLQRAGDELAGRALLQLCLPGLVHLASRWERELGRRNMAAWEVVSQAHVYIVRLGRGEITCNGSIAGHLVRSIHRDLVEDARRSRLASVPCEPLAEHVDRDAGSLGMSAEDHVLSGPLVLDSLRSGVSCGDIAPLVGRILTYVCIGTTVEDACLRSDVGLGRYYRQRPDSIAMLRHRVLTEVG